MVNDIVTACFKENCDVIGVPMKPSALTEIDLNGIQILKNKKNILENIEELKKGYSQIECVKPKVVDNFDKLQEELNKTENDIASYEEDVKWLRDHIINEKAMIETLNNNLEIINNDLRNNKDAAKLRELVYYQ